jgi:Domain of unknown function (DUF4105)
MKVFRIAGSAAVTLVMLLAAAWGAMALAYQAPGGSVGKAMLMAVWLAFSTTAVLFFWRGRPGRALIGFGLGLALVLAWWGSIAPSGNKPWADEVSRELSSHVTGSMVTLDNVRNFTWRSDTDYTQRWETRHYDLEHIRSVDVATSYWMGPAIAHTLVSFGFDDGRFLTFSIEIRKERGEQFSAIGGFFKKFETSLIAADERDILAVRTNVRNEDVYLYRVLMTPQARRSLFLAYLDEAASLSRAPKFYNTLTANCTTIVFEMARRIVPGLPLDWRLLASGYLPAYLQDIHALVPGYSLDTLHAAGQITVRANTARNDPDFSRTIRRGVPGAESPAVP